MENKNLYNDVLAALEHNEIEITNNRGLADMVEMLRKSAYIDTQTIDVFLGRLKDWFENEYGICSRIYTTESGAYAYTMIGMMDFRLHRHATKERAMAAAIIRTIEMINGK